jgi:hypothetical protein
MTGRSAAAVCYLPRVPGLEQYPLNENDGSADEAAPKSDAVKWCPGHHPPADGHQNADRVDARHIASEDKIRFSLWLAAAHNSFHI